MAKEKFTFEAEVSKLLDIVAHSLYSHKEIFLRELISNASDACDRRRYAALTQSDTTEPDGGFRIELSVDKKARTLTIADNGIGMNHDDLVDMLGTVARSGTQAFVDQLSGDSKKDVALIGKFGVGFYSSFMVAKKVEVLTRKAGEDTAWLWISDGRGEFTIDAAERDAAGVSVTLFLDKGEDGFLDAGRLEHIVKTYSDHISIPIVETGGDEEKTLNTASALWTRSAKDITEDQYKEFYHHAGHTFDDPWLTLHNRIEGVLSYTNLLFIPSTQPFDLFQPERKQHVKLYVNRVFITDDCEGLLPPYLRFLRGVVDSEDLPLNISREMLQNNPKLAKIRAGLVKRVLGELKKKADKKPDEYAGFWNEFGAVIKEGIYEDFENRDKIIGISRFRSTASDDLVSLDDYVGRMPEGQDAIYYITGEELEKLRSSPQLEGFKARGIEVLLLTDPVDEFWVPGVGKFAEKPLTSATRGAVDLNKVAVKEGDEEAKKDEKKDAPGMDKLVATFKVALDGMVKDVCPSERLTDSPVCLVAAEGDMDIRLERLLKQHRQLGAADTSLRILEINPGHPLIMRLADLAGGDGNPESALTDAALLLLDQARIVEGESVPDPTAFSRRLAAMMQKGLVV
jgi:molecular chaperone HtpG